jgi:tRNA 2-(methylsulfanyl)-N6-isopentenyladenosine37 hydroxylase
MISVVLDRIRDFLQCDTPQAWITKACAHQDILLLDHAHCEKKAASSALSFIYRYTDKGDLLQAMSRLAREELRHFEMVLSLLQRRGIAYKTLSASAYTQNLFQHVPNQEPDKLIDGLIICAIIEARSCERFAAIAPCLDDELKQFYLSLLKSEARHFERYLSLAKRYSTVDIQPRVDFFTLAEAQYIQSPDVVFRFHSGV